MKIGLEDERVLAVAAADVRLPYWSDLPAPVPRIAKQGGEARPTVEPGKAEPVDGPIPRDQRSSLEIADDCIVFYLGWQLRIFSARVPSVLQVLVSPTDVGPNVAPGP